MSLSLERKGDRTEEEEVAEEKKNKTNQKNPPNVLMCGLAAFLRRVSEWIKNTLISWHSQRCGVPDTWLLRGHRVEAPSEQTVFEAHCPPRTQAETQSYASRLTPVLLPPQL